MIEIVIWLPERKWYPSKPIFVSGTSENLILLSLFPVQHAPLDRMVNRECSFTKWCEKHSKLYYNASADAAFCYVFDDRCSADNKHSICTISGSELAIKCREYD